MSFQKLICYYIYMHIYMHIYLSEYWDVTYMYCNNASFSDLEVIHLSMCVCYYVDG